MSNDSVYDPAGPVLHTDTARRLDAIIRRFGGEPKSIKPIKGKVILPPVGRRKCEGQLAFDEAGDEGTDESA